TCGPPGAPAHSILTGAPGPAAKPECASEQYMGTRRKRQGEVNAGKRFRKFLNDPLKDLSLFAGRQ
ncbi:hypothetical protein, partial [Nevskia soli]|uniref:hypothetical protein n=1 Tax=Nevskia soli TaxID=418856 RepID=UPI00214D3E1D